MKFIQTFLGLLLFSPGISVFAQKIEIYNDSANRFSIGIPTGWIIDSRSKDESVALSVRLENTEEGDSSHHIM